jgi:hypothetical protein
MKLPRRQFVRLVVGAAVFPPLSSVASEQGYPSRPARVIFGFPAGGGSDTIARLMGQWLSERLGQPFVIENRPGNVTNIATEAVVRAPADGYTLLRATSPNAPNATLYPNLNFNFIRDIAPVASIGRIASIMQVNPSFPARRSLGVTSRSVRPSMCNRLASFKAQTPVCAGGQVVSLDRASPQRLRGYQAAARLQIRAQLPGLDTRLA